MKVKIDAAWSLCNVISQGLDAHAEYVIDNHGIPAILCVLSVEMVRGDRRWLEKALLLLCLYWACLVSHDASLQADTRGIVVFLDALQRALTLESRAEFVKEILDEHECKLFILRP